MKYIGMHLSTLGLFGFFSLAFAGDIGPISSVPTNQTGYFVGIGGSYNFARVNSNTSGSLRALSGFPPLGIFSGTTGSYHNNDQTFSPEAQIGYFQPFPASNWLWGLEFMYQYSRIKVTANDHDKGTFINLTNPNLNISNEISMKKVQTKVNNAFMLPVFLGYSLTNSFVYLGAGPSVFRIQNNRYSSSDGLSGFYIGTMDNFSNSKWMWGGSVQTGVAYYVNPTWFLKLNYMYSSTGQYKTNNSVSFSPAHNGGLNSGNMNFTAKQRLITQEVALSINKVL